ncbi:MAG: hypothetical protein KDB07_09155 [Planctomycetes bacterium]|nr:hypothetical protein [Planctomycetota bacterium]
MEEENTKRFTQKVGVKRFTERTSRDTQVHSSTFRARWLEGVLVIESLVSKIDRDDVLMDVFNQSLEKEPEGIILNLQRPRYISSLLIVAIRDIAKRAAELDIPFVAVIHPKLRLLLEMFGITSVVRTGENLDRTVRELHQEISRRHAQRGDNHSA